MEEEDHIQATRNVSFTKISKINSGDNLDTLDAPDYEDIYPENNVEFITANENGLSEDQASRLLIEYGKNELPEKRIAKCKKLY